MFFFLKKEKEKQKQQIIQLSFSPFCILLQGSLRFQMKLLRHSLRVQLRVLRRIGGRKTWLLSSSCYIFLLHCSSESKLSVNDECVTVGACCFPGFESYIHTSLRGTDLSWCLLTPACNICLQLPCLKLTLCDAEAREANGICPVRLESHQTCWGLIDSAVKFSCGNRSRVRLWALETLGNM